jgi:hypothetical protein
MKQHSINMIAIIITRITAAGTPAPMMRLVGTAGVDVSSVITLVVMVMVVDGNNEGEGDSGLAKLQLSLISCS